MASTRKVWTLYGRNGYEGPWTFVNWYASKNDAKREADRLRYQFSERKVLAEFEYEARSRGPRV